MRARHSSSVDATHFRTPPRDHPVNQPLSAVLRFYQSRAHQIRENQRNPRTKLRESGIPAFGPRIDADARGLFLTDNLFPRRQSFCQPSGLLGIECSQCRVFKSRVQQPNYKRNTPTKDLRLAKEWGQRNGCWGPVLGACCHQVGPRAPSRAGCLSSVRL